MRLDPHYHALGIDRRASGAEVAAAWRRLVLQHHPDRAPGAAAALANARTATINVAYREIIRARARDASQIQLARRATAGALIGLAIARLLIAVFDQINGRGHSPIE